MEELSLERLADMFVSPDKDDQDLAKSITDNHKLSEKETDTLAELICNNFKTFIRSGNEEVWVVKIKGVLIPLGRNSQGSFGSEKLASAALSRKCSELIGTGNMRKVYNYNTHSYDLIDVVASPQYTHEIKQYSYATTQHEFIPYKLILYNKFKKGQKLRDFLLKQGIAIIERVI